MNATGAATRLTTRATARDIALGVADRLREPAVVAALATASAAATPQARPWHPGSLAAGHAGIALLFAELAHEDPAYLNPARAHLTAAATHGARLPGGGLHAGIAGLGVAAHAVARTPRECMSIVTACADRAAQAALAAAAAIDVDPSLITFGYYDVITGLAGTARFLLRIRGAADPDVRAATAALVALGRPPRPGKTNIPGWLVPGGPNPIEPDPAFRDGHLNLGLAHGIAGPLAYLALAHTAGVTVPGLDEAIHEMATWLTGWYGRVRQGRGWPSAVSVAEEAGTGVANGGDRGAWCYGTPGIARSLQLATLAGGNPLWTLTAVAAVTDTLDNETAGHGLTSVGVCHGWAGLARAADLINVDAGGDAGCAIDGVVARIIDGHVPDAPLSFRFGETAGDRVPAYAPGLLDGAAGVALSLWSYSRGMPSATHWEDVLLLT